MATVIQEQLSAIARSISERAEQASTSSQYDPTLTDLSAATLGQGATLAQQMMELKATYAAERNLQRAVVERLEREVAVIRGEMAAFEGERSESLARIDRLHRETRQAIDAMMAQVTCYLEERAPAT